MFGLGKKRSKFGKWLDSNRIKQNDLVKGTGVGRTTISDICSEKEHIPKISTWVKIEKYLSSLGHNVDRDMFF